MLKPLTLALDADPSGYGYDLLPPTTEDDDLAQTYFCEVCARKKDPDYDWHTNIGDKLFCVYPENGNHKKELLLCETHFESYLELNDLYEEDIDFETLEAE